MLHFKAVFTLILICIFVFILLALVAIYFYVLKKQKDSDDRNKIKLKLNPYIDAVYTKTHAPGHDPQYKFVLPGRLYGDECSKEERTRLVSMSNPIDPRNINPSLYQQNDSRESFDDVRDKPHIEYSVMLNGHTNKLHLNVNKINNIELKQTEEAYFVATLMPNKEKLKSKSVPKKLDDNDIVFKQLFVFGLQNKDLSESYLNVQVFIKVLNTSHCIGEVYHDLKLIKVHESKNYWKRLKFNEEDQQNITTRKAGQILVCLGYTPATETLKVMILRARNLLEVNKEGEPPNPYVRVAIIQEGIPVRKKKTQTKYQNFNPIFNQSISFNVNLNVLPLTEIQIYVVHDGRMSDTGQNKMTIGFIEIGPQSSRHEYDHWMELMSNRQSSRWHHLIAETKSMSALTQSTTNESNS